MPDTAITSRADFDLPAIFRYLLVAIIGSAVLLGALYWALSHVGHDVSPGRVKALIQNGFGWLFGAYLVTAILGVVLRAMRYRALLQASGVAELPRSRDLLWITAVRNMCVDLLPARLGELVFVGLLKSRAGVTISAGTSALVFAILLDILVLAPFTILIGFLVGFPNRQPYLVAIIALFIGISAWVGVRYVAPFIMPAISSWFQRRSGWMAKVGEFFIALEQAMQSTLAAGVLTKVLVLTILLRIFKYGGLLLLFYAVVNASLPELASVNPLKTVAAMIASEVTASLPIPTLMSFGSWELGGMTLLAFYGVNPADALLTLLAVHVQTQSVDYTIGIIGVLMLWLSAKRFSRNANSDRVASGSRWLPRAAGGLALLVALVVVGFSTQKLADIQAATDDASVSLVMKRPDDSPMPAWLNELNGKIVWSSNRAGNHDIYLYELPGGQFRRLTDSPHTENFARISPDGTKVAFTRSQAQWESLRNPEPWDVWVLDLATGKEQLVAKNGFSPSWTPDGRHLIFQRIPYKIMRVTVATREESVYFESGKDPVIKAAVDMSTPSVGAGQRLAFTFRDRGMPVNIVRDEGGAFHEVHRDSCQVAWSPSGEFTTYVQKGGKQTNQIMRYDPKTKTKTRLIDLPGDLSHEYFPRLSEDESLMVFAASGGGHEHDLADYEIFLWRLGSPAESAVRLTYDAGNDSWPDLWFN